MPQYELFKAWAPSASAWSDWVKPALFAQWRRETVLPGRIEEQWWMDSSWAPKAADGVAIVVDLPDGASVRCGLELLKVGYHPVPLFNTTWGDGAIISLDGIEQALLDGADNMLAARFDERTPPAFLLDSSRLREGRGSPGQFDNRWMVFPQDFPSAAFLRSRGIVRVLVVRKDNLQPGDDLRHVLHRWRKGGLEIWAKAIDTPDPPGPLQLQSDLSISPVIALLGVMLGLRRNSAGGFGSRVPVPSQGGGGFYG